LDALPEAVIIQAANGAVVFANRQGAQLFGYQQTELLGRPFEFLLEERHRAKYRQERTALFDRKVAERYAGESYGLTKNGRPVRIELDLTTTEWRGQRQVVTTIRRLEDAKLRERESEALLEMTASLGAQAHPEAVLRTLVERAADVIDAEKATYAVPWRGRIVVRGRWSEGTWLDDDHEPRKAGILASIFETCRPFRSNDLLREPRVNHSKRQAEGLRSQLAVPLVTSAGEAIGFVSLHNSRRPEGFTERDERIMVAVCETGAAILRRAQDAAVRLEAERAVARRDRQVEALLTVAERLNAAADPEEVLLHVVEVAAELLAVRRVAIVSNEGDHALHRYDWSNGGWERTNQRLPLDGSFSGWVMTHGQSYRSDDVGHDPIGVSPLLKQYGARRVLAVPVFAREGQVMNVLVLSDRLDGEAFSDDDQRLTEGIAHHASVALERATLVQQLRDRERHLHEQAVTDPLTGLANRRLFLEQLRDALSQIKKRGPGVAVVFLDLDGFKVINDSLGHEAGDVLLRGVATRLLQAKRPADTVARFGGDEFAILLTGVSDPRTAFRIAERHLQELEDPFAGRKRERMTITASAGVSFRRFAGDARAAEELMREADIALYQAKANGKRRAAAFEPSMGIQAIQKLALQSDLRRGLEQSEFRLFYQPLVRLDTGAKIAVEALLRWQHPDRGLLLPSDFLPVAEESGLMVALGQWVLQEACRQMVVWRTLGAPSEALRVCVNLSARQFEQPDLVAQVARVLEETGLAPDGLELEITETAVIRDPDTAIATLRALRKLGVRVALDDFGTGYSSLSYLQKLPVDTLKIDRTFLEGLHERGTNAAIVQAAATMAHALGIDVTAEGIETDEQFSAIAKLGCDYGQGYLLSVPLPADEICLMLEASPDTRQPVRLDRA